jgi:hypothetical protein
MITNAPTGVSWSAIPFPKATDAEHLAEQTNICWRAVSRVDSFCHQPLRATVDNEEEPGPGGTRLTIERDTCNAKVILRRWPVISVLAVQVARNNVFPRQWSTVPAGQYAVEHPILSAYTDSVSATAPDGGASISIAPGYVDWRYGRKGFRLLVSFTNGWPHCSLTQAANAGDQTIHVDDVTGWAGASGMVYDGASTEPMAATAVAATTPLQLPNGVGTAQTGAGTVTLAAPLADGHAAGTVVSALPATVLDATILACAAQVLQAGQTAVTIKSLPGVKTSSGNKMTDLKSSYEGLLEPFQRRM